MELRAAWQKGCEVWAVPTPSVCEAHPPVRHPAGSCLLSGEPVSLDGLDTEGKRATQKFGEAGIPSRWLAPSSCRKLTSPDKQGHEVSHWMSLVLLADLSDRQEHGMSFICIRPLFPKKGSDLWQETESSVTPWENHHAFLWCLPTSLFLFSYHFSFSNKCWFFFLSLPTHNKLKIKKGLNVWLQVLFHIQKNLKQHFYPWPCQMLTKSWTSTFPSLGPILSLEITWLIERTDVWNSSHF